MQVHNSACTQQVRAYIHADSGLPLWSPATSSAIGCFRTNPIGSCRCWLLQELSIERWRVVVLCPSRQLHFGDPAPVAEFAEQRVRWIALLSAATNPTAPALVQALARVAGSSQAAEFDAVIAAIQVSRFNGQSIQEPCAMGGISLDDFTQSVAYREIFGRGEAQGEARGEAKVIVRLLSRRCGPLSGEQESLIRSLPLPQLEALAEALLDFEGIADLNAWLTANI